MHIIKSAYAKPAGLSMVRAEVDAAFATAEIDCITGYAIFIYLIFLISRIGVMGLISSSGLIIIHTLVTVEVEEVLVEEVVEEVVEVDEVEDVVEVLLDVGP